MGNALPIPNPSYEQKLRKHRSSIQKKPKKKLDPDHPISHSWPNPIETVFLIILDHTMRFHGITLQEIVNNITTTMDTKTIRNHVKSLMDKGRVQKVDKKYLATLDDTKTGRLVDVAQFMCFDDWGNSDLLACANNYYEKFNAKTDTEKKLVLMANQMGAYIIYTLIEAMNPNNNYLETDKLEGKLSSFWFEQVVSLCAKDLLYKFKKVMFKSMHSPNTSNTSVKKLDNILLNIDDVSKLKQSLRKIYPELMRHFEYLKNALPGKFNNYEDSDKVEIDTEKNQKIQDICKHEECQKYRDYDMGYSIKVCTNCHKVWKTKKLASTNN